MRVAVKRASMLHGKIFEEGCAECLIVAWRNHLAETSLTMWRRQDEKNAEFGGFRQFPVPRIVRYAVNRVDQMLQRSGINMSQFKKTRFAFACLTIGVWVSVSDAEDAGKRRFFDVIRQVLEDDQIFKTVRSLNTRTEKEDRAARSAFIETGDALKMLAWLDNYLRSQVDYAPDEVATFKAKMGHMTLVELKLLFAKLDEERARIRQLHRAQEKKRVMALQRSRPSVSRGYGPPMRQVATPRSSPLASTGAHRAYFNNTPYTQAPVPRQAPSRIPPLISGRTVAQWGVFRSLFWWRW